WSWAQIHMTMKKAIIAVTKSAYATFHEPPPPAATTGVLGVRPGEGRPPRRGRRPDASGGLGLAEELIHFGLVGAAVGADAVADALDDRLGVLALVEGHDAGGDGAEEARLGLAEELQPGRHRREQPVGHQDAQEGADQGRADLVADLVHRAADR